MTSPSGSDDNAATNPSNTGPAPAAPSFVEFVRKYLAVWPVLLACLIGPIVKYLNLLPAYKDHQNVFAAVTSLYGVLFALAAFFYSPMRRSVKKPKGILRNWIPLLLILISVGCLVSYLRVVQDSIREKREQIRGFVPAEQLRTEEILSRTDFTNVPRGDLLMVLYLATFFSAETALVLMALREYVQHSGAASRSRTGKSLHTGSDA